MSSLRAFTNDLQLALLSSEQIIRGRARAVFLLCLQAYKMSTTCNKKHGFWGYLSQRFKKVPSAVRKDGQCL